MQATYCASAHGEMFPRYLVQPANPKIILFLETKKKEIHVSFTGAKTLWN